MAIQFSIQGVFSFFAVRTPAKGTASLASFIPIIMVGLWFSLRLFLISRILITLIVVLTSIGCGFIDIPATCEHKDIANARHEAVTEIRMSCQALKLPVNFVIAFVQPIRVTTHRANMPRSEIPSIAKAIEDQTEIGFHNMVLGFLADSWTSALASMKVEQPKTMMDQLLALIWDTLCEEFGSSEM